MPPPFVIDALAVTAEGKGRDDLLWPSATGGYLGPLASKQSWLAGAVARCQQTDPTFPRITAHGLRHTAASLAISAGGNPKVVQRMLGQRGDDVGCLRGRVRLRPGLGGGQRGRTVAGCSQIAVRCSHGDPWNGVETR
jgi:hypothetical protein